MPTCGAGPEGWRVRAVVRAQSRGRRRARCPPGRREQEEHGCGQVRSGASSMAPRHARRPRGRRSAARGHGVPRRLLSARSSPAWAPALCRAPGAPRSELQTQSHQPCLQGRDGVGSGEARGGRQRRPTSGLARVLQACGGLSGPRCPWPAPAAAAAAPPLLLLPAGRPHPGSRGWAGPGAGAWCPAGASARSAGGAGHAAKRRAGQAGAGCASVHSSSLRSSAHQHAGGAARAAHTNRLSAGWEAEQRTAVMPAAAPAARRCGTLSSPPSPASARLYWSLADSWAAE